jgi:hypothetical protein
MIYINIFNKGGFIDDSFSQKLYQSLYTKTSSISGDNIWAEVETNVEEIDRGFNMYADDF